MATRRLQVAALNARRDRRRERSGAPFDLSQTQSYAGGDSVLAASFPDRARPISFWTRVRTLGTGNPTGIIFAMGNATTAVAAYYASTAIVFRVGDVPAADKVLVVLPGSFNTDREYDISGAIVPATGEVQLWGFGGARLTTAVASGGSLPNGWAAAVDGIYGAAAPGALPADVTETGAPTNFEVTSRLRVYDGAVPKFFRQ